MTDQDISSTFICLTCCVWPVVVWFGLNMLLLPEFRRRVLGLLPGGARAARRTEEV